MEFGDAPEAVPNGEQAELPPIAVDYREEVEELLASLANRGYRLHRRQLAVGDYHISPDTVVERKTLNDFCRSLADGRLFRQAFRLSESAQNPILLLEGSCLDHPSCGTRLEAVKGALVSLSQSFRIPVLRSRDQADSAWYLQVLARQRARIGTHAGVLKGYRPKRLTTQREYVLRSLPGIGPKLARTLLEIFGSVAAVAGASQKDLSRVPGLGEKKSIRIHSIFHLNTSAPGSGQALNR